MINKTELISFLQSLEIKKRQLTTEGYVEKLLVTKLKEKFEDVHPQYNIGGYLGLKVDIDMGNGEYGIELKLEKNLSGSAASIQRLFGQIIYYSKRRYGSNMTVLIVGGEKEAALPYMKEVKSFIEELGVGFCYLVAR